MKRENAMKKTAIQKIISLSAIMVLVMGPLLSSCNSKKEPTIGAPTKSVATPQETKPEDKAVDIIVPEIAVTENEEFLKKDIFDLWDIFFESFVSVVSEKPLDTRVNYKSMHQLRTSRDSDFLELVSMIEKKMASTDLESLDKNTKKAFLINAYNYAAIRLVNKGFVDSDGKMISSIKNLSKTFYDKEILIRNAIQFSDGLKSLDGIMKEDIRPLFSQGGRVKDARFYFLLSGATLGRAVQMAQAIRPETLEAQLTFATENALKMTRYLKQEGDTLRVARFFKWYKSDFEEAYGTVEDFFAQNGIKRDTFTKIRHQDFSWELNDQARFTGVVIEEPKQPLPPIAEEGKEDDIIPTEPCDYLKSDKVQVLGYCNQVIEGRMNGFYKYDPEVVEAKVCVYSRDLGDGERSLGINGTVVEISEKSGNKESVNLAVEDKLKKWEEKLRIRIAEGVRTTLEYLQTDRRLTVRQTSVVPGKGYRKFLLQCE